MMKQATARKNVLSVNMMTKVALLATAAGVLMLLEFPLWFAPPFYKLDLSELPVLIGALSLGPAAGAIIELIKILINFVLNGTITGGVGEAANFIIGCSFVLPVAFIYQRQHHRQGLIVGFVCGIVSMCIIGALVNGLILLPVYATVFSMPIEGLIAMGTMVNNHIVDLFTFVLWAVVPFNLVKGCILSLLTFFLYKRLSSSLEK